MSLIKKIKSALFLPAIVIMVISLYVESTPKVLITISSWYIVIVCSLELLFFIYCLIVSLFESPEDLLIHFLTFAIPIIVGVLAIIFKTQILTFLHAVREVSKFQWVAMSGAIYFGIRQITCLPTYLYHSSYIPDDNPFA